MSHPLRSADCEVAVVGAGPYGLSVAAHLRAAGVHTRVFGRPMSFWQDNMPKGMLLRSSRGASNLSDAGRALTLDAFERASGAAPQQRLPLEAFVSYALWFQKRALPDADRRLVSRIARRPGGFTLTLEDGTVGEAGRVVMALGLGAQHLVPAAFAGLPEALVSHSSAHADLAPFRGRHVAVIGRGQSAVGSAVLLREAGAEVELIANGPIRWLEHEPRRRLALRNRLSKALAAPSAIGPFPLSWMAEAPGLVHRLPMAAKARLNERSLRAAAAGWLRARFEGIAFHPGCVVTGADAEGDGVALRLDGRRARFDHVMLGTGYVPDIGKPGVLAPELLGEVARREGSPILGAGLEASVPGLHFVGSSAVASYGPQMRFIAGCGFAARTVTRSVVAQRRRTRVPVGPYALDGRAAI